MLNDSDRKKLRDVNADHHVRMRQLSANNRMSGREEDFTRLDEASRGALVLAMEGARSRYRLEVGEPPVVLELGTGSGRDIEYLSRRFAAKYRGVEVVPEVAIALNDERVVCMPLEDLPGTALRFISPDYIYSRHVMEHTADVDSALLALKKTLATGGVIGAVTPLMEFDNEPAHLSKLSIEEWIHAYELHGLKVVYATKKEFAVPEAHLVAIHQERYDASL